MAWSSPSERETSEVWWRCGSHPNNDDDVHAYMGGACLPAWTRCRPNRLPPPGTPYGAPCVDFEIKL